MRYSNTIAWFSIYQMLYFVEFCGLRRSLSCPFFPPTTKGTCPNQFSVLGDFSEAHRAHFGIVLYVPQLRHLYTDISPKAKRVNVRWSNGMALGDETRVKAYPGRLYVDGVRKIGRMLPPCFHPFSLLSFTPSRYTLVHHFSLQVQGHACITMTHFTGRPTVDGVEWKKASVLYSSTISIR